MSELRYAVSTGNSFGHVYRCSARNKGGSSIDSFGQDDSTERVRTTGTRMSATMVIIMIGEEGKKRKGKKNTEHKKCKCERDICVDIYYLLARSDLCPPVRLCVCVCVCGSEYVPFPPSQPCRLLILFGS